MMPPADQPWFHAALQLLDLRPQDRVLAITCEASQVHDLATLVGKRGEVTVVCSNRERAEEIADRAPARVEVISHTIVGDEHFGTFDAMLVNVPCGPLLPSGRYGELAVRNLRPGGRCAIDLPGRDMVPDLTAALAGIGWPKGRVTGLQGIGDDELAEVLRSAGLRGVHGLLGSHLLHLTSPTDLVDMFQEALDLDPAERQDLDRSLVSHCGGTGPFDALVHRTRLQALR